VSHRSERVFELVGAAHLEDMYPHPDFGGGTLCLFNLESSGWFGRVPENGYLGQVRHGLLEKLQTLGDGLTSLPSQSRDIPPGVRKATHEPEADRIRWHDHHDRDRLCRGEPRLNRVVNRRNDDIDVELHQLGGEVREPRDVAMRPSPLYGDVLPI
jgi:hypothetical protein